MSFYEFMSFLKTFMSFRMLHSRIVLILNDDPAPCDPPPMASTCSQEAHWKKQWSHRAKKEIHSHELNLIQVLCASPHVLTSNSAHIDAWSGPLGITF